MANGLNQCNFIGNLGRDPETNYLPDGKCVCKFSIGVTEKWGDKETTEWVRAVCFDKLAEIAGKYLSKGKQVFVSGQQRTRKWENDGATHYSTETIVREMRMLGGKPQDQQEQSQGHDAPPQDTPEDGIPF